MCKVAQTLLGVVPLPISIFAFSLFQKVSFASNFSRLLIHLDKRNKKSKKIMRINQIFFDISNQKPHKVNWANLSWLLVRYLSKKLGNSHNFLLLRFLTSSQFNCRFILLGGYFSKNLGNSHNFFTFPIPQVETNQ